MFECTVEIDLYQLTQCCPTRGAICGPLVDFKWPARVSLSFSNLCLNTKVTVHKPKVDKCLITAYELTIAAHAFKINHCAAHGVKRRLDRTDLTESIVRGRPFMTSTTKSGFFPSVHMGRTPIPLVDV